jgi:hypothetical protein
VDHWFIDGMKRMHTIAIYHISHRMLCKIW